MMLPILISVSVTPGSYFFCASADTEAVAMISPENPSDRPSVLMKSLSARIMKLLLGPGVTVFCRTVSSSFVFVSGATLAGVRLCREERGSEVRLVAPNSCSAAQQITCADTKGGSSWRLHVPPDSDPARPGFFFGCKQFGRRVGAGASAAAPPDHFGQILTA